MGIDVVFTKEAFAKKLIHIATELDTEYNNDFPYNCGYVNKNGKVSWDCWNMPKTMIWGWQENDTVGYFCYHPGLYGLDDLTGGGIMALCDGVSGDFTEVIQSEFLLTADKKHAGMFVDEFTDRLGQLCNVVECTTSWNEHRVIGSWVDPDGTRRNCKGGIISKSWDKHGKLPWVDYGTQPVPHKRITENGWWDNNTSYWLQKMLGTEPDGIISSQPMYNKQFCVNVSTTSWEFTRSDAYGSDCIESLQKLVGAKQDRFCGIETITKLQQLLESYGYYDVGIDGYMGYYTVVGLQRLINAYFQNLL